MSPMLDHWNGEQEQRIFGLTGSQWRQGAAQACVRYGVAPLSKAINIMMNLLAVAFVLRFGLEVAGSERLANTNVAELARVMTDPFLAPAWLWLAGFKSMRADTFQAVPMLLALATWAVRPVLEGQLNWLADQLEGRNIESVFQVRPAGERETDRRPRWGRRFRQAASAGEPTEVDASTDYSKLEEYARLIPTPGEQTLGGHGLDMGPHRLSAIGFDSETRLQVIGRYELLQELSRGPMGVVYKAYDLQIGRAVVVKLLDSSQMDEDELQLKKQRLFKEARAAGKLVHPGLVSIFDISEDERGNPYIVMEHVEGETLETALTPTTGRELLSLPERLDVAIEIAQAVEYAHNRGVIHRDLKPSNVLLTSDGHAKLVDFGIARLIEFPRGRSAGPVAAEQDDGVPGTPEFVAPELLQGIAAGRASDIFSLGVTLYWIFTGDLPFSGRSVTEITYNVAHNTPAPVRQLNWALPADLDAVLSRCMAKDPLGRYGSAGELASDLQALRYSHSARRAAIEQVPRTKAG